MRLFVAAALLCAVATVSAFPHPEDEHLRFRRQNNQIRVQGNIPVGRSRQQPSVDLNYEHRFVDNGRRTVDGYGGLNIQSGRVQPHAGVRFEHNFGNGMYFKGYGQGQTGHRGRIEPSFGAGLGLRFRRDVEGAEEADVEYEEE